MKLRIARLALCLACAVAAPLAHADVCAVDPRPGATLLIPYFEVDLDSANGVTTLFWVRNTADRPKLINMVFWTNNGVPGVALNVYLSARGTHRFNLADVFRSGLLPTTGPTITPMSPFDSVGTQVNFPACNNSATADNTGPNYRPLSGQSLAELQARFVGQPSPTSGQCFGRSEGDNVARGYITIDSVSQCSGQTYPNNPGYFVDGGVGIANNENILIGGFELIDVGNNFASSAAAIALEADSTVLVPGAVSFYGRFDNFIGQDDREPLPSSWAADFDGESGSGSAELIIWRATPNTNPTFCGGAPNWFPLGQTENTPFDRNGNTPLEPFFPPGTAILAPGATQRVDSSQINTSLEPPAVVAGSARLNFTTTIVGQNPPYPHGQSWVGVLHSSQGRFSELTEARALDSSCDGVTPVPAAVNGPVNSNPNTRNYIFLDGFSS